MLALHSALAPPAAVAALRRSIDREQRTLFSLSGYKGDRPVIGDVADDAFRLQKRRYWRNDFAPNFYGKFTPLPTGTTRIEGYFDVSPSVRKFMRLWLIFVVLFGVPAFVLSILDLTTGTRFTTGNVWVGVIAPPAMVVWGILLPRIGRLFAVGDERYLLDHIQHALAAEIEQSEHAANT